MINVGLGIGVSLPFLEAMPDPGTAHCPQSSSQSLSCSCCLNALSYFVSWCLSWR